MQEVRNSDGSYKFGYLEWLDASQIRYLFGKYTSMKKNKKPIIIEPDDNTTASDQQLTEEEIEEGMNDAAVESHLDMSSLVLQQLTNLKPIPQQKLCHPLIIADSKLNICDLAQDFHR